MMLTMLEEAGVKALYNNTFVDVKMKKLLKKETAIEAVIVKNAAGLQAIKGKIFIDGSGTAEVAARSGAPYVRGGGPQPPTVSMDKQNRPLPGGLLWTMGGVDFEEVSRYQKSQNDPTLSKVNDYRLEGGSFLSSSITN
jgi:hypothetical protein